MAKEIPILFSTPMVKAILEGRKTQTRRTVNFKKIAKVTGCTKGTLAYSDTFKSWAVFNGNGDADLCLVNCPYGQPGDLLWVRETWREYNWTGDQWTTSEQRFEYAADNPEMVTMIDGDGFQMFNKNGTEKFLPWKPSIHMPKDRARIWLQVESVGVERLQDISEEDARAEGIRECTDPLGGWTYKKAFGWLTAKEAYQSLWESINGPDSWEANPFVWKISFKVLSTNGKP